MYVSKKKISDRTWLFSSLISSAVLYLGLVWKTTENIDRLTTDALFWGVIIWLIWRKKDSLDLHSDAISSFIGLFWLGIVLVKTITLFKLETVLLPLLPVSSAIALALIASGFKGLGQYAKELLCALFLFFPTEVIGFFIDNIIHITIINAKVATYLLYYLGFKVGSVGNEVILYLPELGKFKAIVNYSCAGMPMIILILKLALLLISCTSFARIQQILISLFSISLGFSLGVIRICILTLLIPNPTLFEYWHGEYGSQIFSTLAIIIFSVFCYWMLQPQQNQQPKIIN